MKNIGNVFILGDSYSTFEGYIDAARGCQFWYPNGGKDETDVKDFTQTWWHKVLAATESNLLLNQSFSGTTICNTTYGGAYCPKYSFMGRFDALALEGFFKDNRIDTFFIFGGTNDNWANAPIGTLKYENISEEDKKSALPAICHLFARVKEELGDSRIIFIMNTEFKKELTEGYETACRHFGIELLKLHDIDKLNGHPSIKGMAAIADQVLEIL